MPEVENKVQYNLKNVHFHPITGFESDMPQYAEKIANPGAVTYSLSPQGNTTVFYADGIAYHTTTANNGYNGELETAKFVDKVRTEIFEEELNETDKVFIENAMKKGKPFGMTFEFDGDQKAVRHVLYYCTATRPNIESSTTTDSVEVKTEKITVTASPLPNGLVKARTGPETTKEVYDAWHDKPWMPAASLPAAAKAQSENTAEEPETKEQEVK